MKQITLIPGKLYSIKQKSYFFNINSKDWELINRDSVMLYINCRSTKHPNELDSFINQYYFMFNNRVLRASFILQDLNNIFLVL